jgi:hypothetical protein
LLVFYSNMNKKQATNYQQYYANREVYEKANIIWIDNFIIRLIRNHIIRSSFVTENSLICHPWLKSQDYIKECLNTGFTPAMRFIYLDKQNYINDINHIPILYHNPRHANHKNIPLTLNQLDANDILFKFDFPIEYEHWRE